MHPITFTPQSYQIDGQSTYLLSGEFHYFRVPKADWRARMRLFRAAGGNTLATYIPWLLHEPQEGQFRFEGEDWLELEGFLQAAQEEGLYVIARPGPYQYSELIYHGLPGWLIEQYPQVLALDPRGKPIGYASISYTHPLFLEKVRAWFAAVCPILARYTVSQGGPIAFTQIDNELVGIHEWFGGLDYHPLTMGFGRPDGAYPRFLQARYGQVETLNQAYDTAFASLLEALPSTDPHPTTLTGIRQRKDYFDFYLSTIADYAQTLVGLLRELGIDTPIVHNSANPGMNAYFKEVAQRLGSSFLLGSDHYYTLGQDWPQNNPTPQYAARVFVSLEMLRLMGYPPTVFEMPGGSASNWPPVTPSDALTCYLTNLAYGMKGSNYYIFTGGPNPPGAGTTTDLYDYDASIGANGEVRPLYTAQQVFGQVAHNHLNLLDGERLSDFRLGMDLEYARSEIYWQKGGEYLLSNSEAWSFLRRGILTTALCASLSPRFVDLGQPDTWFDDTSTPLVIASSASMARAAQEGLVRFLQNGGRLLIAPLLPSLDEALQPCTLLADFLGAPAFQVNRRGISRPRVLDVANVQGQVYFPEHLPEGAEPVGQEEVSGQPCAWQQALAGGGQVIVLGLTWSQAMREHEHMFRALLHRLGLNQVIHCDNPNLWVTAWVRGRQATLFVLNLFTSPLSANLRLTLEGREVYNRSHTVDSISVQVVDFQLAV